VDREATAPETLAAVAAPRAGASEAEAVQARWGQRACGGQRDPSPPRAEGGRAGADPAAAWQRRRRRRRGRRIGWGDQGAAGAAGGSIFGVVVVRVRETGKSPQDPAREEKKGKWDLFFPSLSFLRVPARLVTV